MDDEVLTARPILFSGPMVRALMEGRKTQTRRIINGVPDHALDVEMLSPCPYGQTGDLLWVREKHAISEGADDDLNADGHKTAVFPDTTSETLRRAIRWTPSIHMPRWASRLTLEITDVRVQRVQEISEEDAKAEGVTMRARCCGYNKLDDGWSMDSSRVGTPCKWGHDGKTLSEGDLALVFPQSAFGSYINELHGGRYWSSKSEKTAMGSKPLGLGANVQGASSERGCHPARAGGSMTDAETILKLIEAVDPADTAKLDEIDARVWCYLHQARFQDFVAKDDYPIKYSRHRAR